jgi:hypothetical protein
MARLRGWERVLIVLWVLWGLGAGIFTYNVGMKYRLSTARHDCWKAHYEAPPSFNLEECINKNIAHHRPRLLIAALAMSVVAALFAPVPLLGWALVNLILFLVRWVKQGFSSTHI